MTGRLPDGNVATVEITPPGSRAANPGFDVTPARLVTGFITEARHLRRQRRVTQPVSRHANEEIAE